VVCKATLDAGAGGHSCSRCHKPYPRLAGVPVLVADIGWWLKDQLVVVARMEQRAQRALDIVTGLLGKTHPREAALIRMRDGIQRNLALVRRWSAELVACASPAVKAAAAMGAEDVAVSAVIEPLKYFIADWGGQPASEASIAAIVASLRGHLAGRDLRTVAVLGGGAGRVAWELTRDCEQVHLFDLSAMMALTYEWLRREDIVVHQVVEMNVREVSELYPAVRLAMSERPVQYAIADALHLPVADGSLSAALSVYMTDVVGNVEAFVTEAARVLAPGGAFIHFGTLGYGGFNPPEMWTAAELRELLARHGFRVEREEWVPHRLWPSTSMVQTHVNAWSVLAIKVAGDAAPRTL
jgi:SAM-dependent methyltransferase